MSLTFSNLLDSTKSEITDSNQYSQTEPSSIQHKTGVSYNFDSTDDFLNELGITSTLVVIEDNDELETLLNKLEELGKDSNFELTEYSTESPYVYNFSYNREIKTTSYGDRVTKYYLNLKATADAGEDTNEIQVDDTESNITLNTVTEISSYNLIITITYNAEVEAPQEIEVTSSEYGSFPSGTSADYCILLLHADEDYISTRGVSQIDLDGWAIDYLNKLNEYGLDDDEEKYSVSSSYYGYDSNTGQYYVLVEKESTDEELENEWNELHGTAYDLENTIVQSNEKECYKVYVTGWCQLVGFDDNTLISDQGGNTEKKFYSYPNGYYILVGNQLRLFILDKIAKVDYELNSNSCIWYPVTNPENGTELTLSSRTVYQNGNYYFYMGKRVTEANIFNFPIDHSDTSAIIQNASNLRFVLVSNSVLELETFAAIANPTNGLLLSNSLTAIGRYSFGSGGSSIVRIFSRIIEYIGEQAFPSTANTVIIMCKEEDYESVNSNNNSYIDLPATVTYIGLKAFYELYIGVLNAAKCVSLTHVGIQCFAAAPSMKTIYLNYNTLDINDTGELIYLPDAIEYSIGTYKADSSQYNGSGSNSDKSNSMAQATFGTDLSGSTKVPLTSNCYRKTIELLEGFKMLISSL